MSQDPNNPVVLCDFLTDLEATLVIEQLEGVGIQAIRSGAAGDATWSGAANYTQVVVRERDLERAKKILEDTSEAR